MFFNCTSCSTRLELPDEQVVNRVLKVRCTGCGTVMVVRDPATSRGERPAEAQWFYAIAGQQLGPVTVGGLADLVRSGQVDTRTFLWTAGMAQWSRAGEVPALSSLFAPQAPPPLPPPLPAPQPPTPAARDVAKAELEAKAKAELEAKAKAELEAKARAQAELEAKAKAELEAKAKAELEAKARAQAELEAKTRAELEARAKAELEAKAKAQAEAEAKAKAEQEAKAKAEAEAKARAEQDAKAKAEQAAKAKAEQEAKAKAEQEAKAKAEQEAKAQAEAEAKARAEQEAKAKAQAEQEAKAKAEQEARARAQAEAEAKARAEQEAKAKAEQEAKAKAQAEAEAKAEQEAKAKAEQEAKAKVEQAARAKAEQAARQKAEIDALVRAELEAKAKADRAEQELRDAVSQALAAASAEPEPPKAAPTSLTQHLEDDFFSSPPAPAPVDIFANLDEKPDEQELADFRKTLRAARPEAGPRSPTRAEMRALAQEFSVVTKLEQHKKRHGLWIGLGVGAAAAIVAIVLLVVPSGGGPELAANDEGFEAFQRRLYDAPVAPTEPELAPEPDQAAKTNEKPQATPNKRPPVTVRKEPKAEGTGKPAAGEVKKPITAAQYAALTEDSLGKSEFKLDFDSSAAAKKAAEEAAAKKAQRADELSAEVASAFGKKKSQFAKCSDDLQERIRVVFTVAPTGKVSGPDVSGSKSSAKSQCIQQILERSIFPAGDTDLTYSQVLVL